MLAELWPAMRLLHARHTRMLDGWRPTVATQGHYGMWKHPGGCFTVAWLMVRALYLLALTYLYGGAFSLEHPADREDPQREPPAPHWCIWRSGFVAQITQSGDVTTTQFLQGPLGQPFAKPTAMMTARLPNFAHAIFSQYDLRWRRTVTLGGKEDGMWKAARSKVYPTQLCKAIALQFIEFEQTCHYEGQTEEPADLAAAVAALGSMWDPYWQSGAAMASDFLRQGVDNLLAA